eukprot:scaffold28857_cov17-Tisochrysis_lutea.AAC.3
MHNGSVCIGALVDPIQQQPPLNWIQSRPLLRQVPAFVPLIAPNLKTCWEGGGACVRMCKSCGKVMGPGTHFQEMQATQHFLQVPSCESMEVFAMHEGHGEAENAWNSKVEEV